MMDADAGRVRQLLHNLFKNALEAVRDRERGMLSLRSRWVLEAGERYIDLSFEDNGSGFSDEVRSHPTLFQSLPQRLDPLPNLVRADVLELVPHRIPDPFE